jgi:5-methylthioribose kinase
MLELLIDQRPAIQARLRELAWIDDDEQLLRLSSPGEGNMNRTLRADLGGRTLILKQSTPFVARYPEIPAPAERIEVEAAFYRAVEDSEASSALPNVIGFDPDNRLLAFEDLGEAADYTDLYAGPCAEEGAPAELAALAEWLSTLHATPVQTTDRGIFQNRAMRALNHAHIFEIPFDPDNGLDLEAITPGLSEEARRAQSDPAILRRVAALGAMYLADESPESVLLHGDYYPGSWLRHADGIKIIDPEFAFIGPPEFDIGVLLAHMVFAGAVPVDVARIVAAAYQAPFDAALAGGFAGVEIMRRLLGVAQLPLTATLTTKATWLNIARAMLEARAMPEARAMLEDA